MMGMRAKKNCMAMLLIVGGIVAVFLADRKVAEKIHRGRVPTFFRWGSACYEREWKNLFSGRLVQGKM